MVMSRSKLLACFPWFSNFNSSLLGYIFLKDERNFTFSFIVHRLSMNIVVAAKISEIIEIILWTYLAQNGAGSNPVGIEIFMYIYIYIYIYIFNYCIYIGGKREIGTQ